MKRTNTMKYNPTAESRELLLFSTNNEQVYKSSMLPALVNLDRKAKAGTYDPDKAVDMFYYVIMAANDVYNKWYGYSFSVTDRFTAAVELEKYWHDEIINNELFD